jgi:hypothetical protein
MLLRMQLAKFNGGTQQALQAAADTLLKGIQACLGGKGVLGDLSKANIFAR